MSMADSGYRFRFAMGGFHKGDVTAYIEKTAAQHRSELLDMEAQLTSLREENRALQQQLNLLMMATPVTPAPPAPVEPVVTAAPVRVPDPAPVGDMASLELQAYRRAEAVERNANARARKLYKQMEGLCEDTLEEFRDTDTAVKQVIQVMQQQAASLEQAYETLSAALDTSREKLAAMNEMLCVEDEAK
jgi:hypothetical protein